MILIDLTKNTSTHLINQFKSINIIYCLKDKELLYHNKYNKFTINNLDDYIDNKLLLEDFQSILYNWAKSNKINDKNIFQYLKYNNMPSIYWLLNNWHLFIFNVQWVIR